MRSSIGRKRARDNSGTLDHLIYNKNMTTSPIRTSGSSPAPGYPTVSPPQRRSTLSSKQQRQHSLFVSGRSGQKYSGGTSTKPKGRKNRTAGQSAHGTQLCLDFGQQGLEERTCVKCEMTYQPGLPHDKAAHDTYCRSVDAPVRLRKSDPTFTLVLPVQIKTASILSVLMTASQRINNKKLDRNTGRGTNDVEIWCARGSHRDLRRNAQIRDIQSQVDRALGGGGDIGVSTTDIKTVPRTDHEQVFVAVNVSDGGVVGCVVVKPISTALRVKCTCASCTPSSSEQVLVSVSASSFFLGVGGRKDEGSPRDRDSGDDSEGCAANTDDCRASAIAVAAEVVGIDTAVDVVTACLDLDSSGNDDTSNNCNTMNDNCTNDIDKNNKNKNNINNKNINENSINIDNNNNNNSNNNKIKAASESKNVIHDESKLMISELGSKRASASLGVDKVWVHKNHRRAGLAQKLIDCARHHASYGHVVTHEHVAFSQPTTQGAAFARQYIGRHDFLVF